MTRKKPAQPAVAKNTGSAASVCLLDAIPTEGGAGATPPADGGTPSAGGAVPISCAIDDRGELAIVHPEAGVVRFTPDQVLALGDFLRLSEPLWRL